MPNKRPRTISEHIETAPPQAQEHLRKLYTLMKRVAPDATEAIKRGTLRLKSPESC